MRPRTILDKRNAATFQTEWKTEERVSGRDKAPRKEAYNQDREVLKYQSLFYIAETLKSIEYLVCQNAGKTY